MNTTEITHALKSRYEGLSSLASAYGPVIEGHWAPVQTRIEGLRAWWEGNHMTARLPYGIAAAVILGSLVALNQGLFVAPAAQPAYQVAERVAPIGTLTLMDGEASPRVAAESGATAAPGANLN
jgi:hypothetical protein